MEQPQSPNGGYQVDPARAFQALQRNTAQQIAQMHADMAAKDAAIEQLMEENQHLRQSVDALTDQINGTPQTQDGPGGVPLVPPPPVPAEMLAAPGGVQPIPTGEHVPEPTLVMGPPHENSIEVGR